MEAAISIIIPTLNEAANLEETVRRARRPGVVEIIVVDGGSSDATRSCASAIADEVLESAPGRARQMNAGAQRAHGDILLFLHADTHLPTDFADVIGAACHDVDVVAGRFDLRLEPSSPLLSLVAALINARSRATRVATGDQAIFVRRTTFERLGGYAEIPLMEDIELCRRLKRCGRIACLRDKVTTSSRRWRRHGVIRTILLMWTLKSLYLLGVSPERLSRLYRHAR